MLRSGRVHSVVALALLGTPFVPLAAEWAHAGPARDNQRQHQQPGSPCRQLDGRVVVRDGRLSVNAAGQSVAVLLGAVAHCMPGLAVSVASELEDEPVSLAFGDLPIHEGLRRIVRAYDAFFYYGTAASAPVLERLWVFPQGKGDGLAPLDATAWASDADVEKRLTDAGPDIRFRALKALVERRGDAAMGAVLAALADPDEVVRAQVLDLALGSGLQIPSDRLAALVLSDPSALIRLQALQNAPEGPELAILAESAQSDPDRYVQMAARSILARVAAAPAGDTQARPLPQQ